MADDFLLRAITDSRRDRVRNKLIISGIGLIVISTVAAGGHVVASKRQEVTPNQTATVQVQTEESDIGNLEPSKQQIAPPQEVANRQKPATQPEASNNYVPEAQQARVTADASAFKQRTGYSSDAAKLAQKLSEIRKLLQEQQTATGYKFDDNKQRLKDLDKEATSLMSAIQSPRGAQNPGQTALMQEIAKASHDAYFEYYNASLNLRTFTSGQPNPQDIQKAKQHMALGVTLALSFMQKANQLPGN